MIGSTREILVCGHWACTFCIAEAIHRVIFEKKKIDCKICKEQKSSKA